MDAFIPPVWAKFGLSIFWVTAMFCATSPPATPTTPILFDILIIWEMLIWLVVSTHLKNINHRSFPQVGVKIKNIFETTTF